MVFLTIIGLLALFYATYIDIKTKEIPDWLTYGLIGFALGYKLIYSAIFKNFSYFLTGLTGFFVFLIIALLMYYSKQWGGGDAKLLMGLGVVFTSYPNFLLNYFNPKLEGPFLLTLLVNIFFVGALYGLFFSFYMAFKNKNKFLKTLKKIVSKKIFKTSIFLSLFLSITLFASAFFLQGVLKMLFNIMAIFVLIYPYLWTLIKAVENSSMYKKISPEKLVEGDWVAEDLFIKNKRIYSKKSYGIEKKQINLLIKNKFRKVLVKDGLAFVPVFLVGVLLSLIFGSVILYLI